jgi:adenylate cyclase class 2
MRFEVEQKFPVEDLPTLEMKLCRLGAEFGEAHEEVDLYYRHPSRDFAETDEALRIRRKGSKCSITYKGPKVDTTTKTRREIDLKLPPDDGTAEAWGELLEALGFEPVAEVRKSRRLGSLGWEGANVEASLDDVEQVGTYVELELIAEAEDVEAAKSRIALLAERLGLADSERKSYLELLLERRGAASG